MAKIKVCYYIEHWASGGIEAFITNTLEGANLSGYSVDIVAAKICESIYTERLAMLGVSFYELSGALRSPKNSALFRARLREGKYDILHLHIFHGVALELAAIAKSEGVPVRIAHSHGAGLRNSVTRWLKLILHRLGAFFYGGAVTERLACSVEAGRFLFGNSPVRVIKNGIDTDKFLFNKAVREAVRAELGVGEGVLVGHVGRISPEKNHRFLIEVFAKYKKINKDAKLILIGEGEGRSELEEYARELGIAEDIIWVGASKRVPDLLFAMDIFLFPSTVEGLGIAAIEAQAAGLPVITSDRVPEAARLSESAVALPISDADSWATSIDGMLKEHDRAIGPLTVRAAGFDSHAVGEELFSLYASLIEGQGE